MDKIKKRGKIVWYLTKDGEKQKAFMYDHEQTKEFTGGNRAFLRLVNNDMTPKKGEGGKKEVAVKQLNNLRLIGFID